MGYIYKITNKVNNKIYIGKTTFTIENRWKEHCETAINHKDNTLLHKAINKYGVNNFTIESIEECSNDILNEREVYWIGIFNSYYLENKNGYNMTRGGEGNLTYSDKIIIELWNEGYRCCEIAKILNAKETTISIRLRSLGFDPMARRNEYNKKSVMQYNINGNLIKIWDCASNAEKELNISSGSISRCCKKERTIAGNFLWKLTNDYNTSIEELMYNYAKSNKCTMVDMIDDKNNIIKTYTSGKQAEQELNISRGKISEVCNHKYGRQTAGGYRWQWSYPLKRYIVDNE